MVVRDDLELGAPSQKIFSREVREILNLRVVWSRCTLEWSVRTFSSAFIYREVLDTLPVLQGSKLGPYIGLPALHRREFGPDRLDAGGEGLDLASQGGHCHIRGKVIGSHAIEKRISKVPGHVRTGSPVIPYQNFNEMKWWPCCRTKRPSLPDS